MRGMRDIMAQLTVGDTIGLFMIVISLCMTVVSVVWAIKSKGQSLIVPLALSSIGAVLAQAGAQIARLL